MGSNPTPSATFKHAIAPKHNIWRLIFWGELGEMSAFCPIAVQPPPTQTYGEEVRSFHRAKFQELTAQWEHLHSPVGRRKVHPNKYMPLLKEVMHDRAFSGGVLKKCPDHLR